MSLTERGRAYVEKLASPILKPYIIEHLGEIALFHQAASLIDSGIRDINYTIHTTFHPLRLQEKLSDLLLLTDKAIPETLCNDIIQHQTLSCLISEEIKEMIQPGLPLRKEARLYETVKQLNQAIIASDKEEISALINALGIASTTDLIERALSIFEQSFRGPQIADASDKCIGLIRVLLQNPSMVLRKVKKPFLLDPLVKTSIELSIELDKTLNISAVFVEIKPAQYVFFRDARYVSEKEVADERASSVRHYYSQLGIDYVLSVRTSLLMAEIFCDETKALDEFLLEHLLQYFKLLGSKNKDQSINTNQLSQRCEAYIHYQLAPILVKYGLVMTTEEAISTLNKVKPWVRLSMPSIVYATAYEIDRHCIVVVDTPLVQENEDFVVEWDKVKHTSTRPFWYETLSSEEKAIFLHFYPYLKNHPTLPSDLSFKLPGLKEAYRQAIYLNDDNGIWLLGEVKHSSIPVFLSTSIERKNKEESWRLSTIGVRAQKKVLGQHTSQLNIMLIGKQNDEVLQNRLDPSAISFKESVIHNAKKNADEEGVLFSYVSMGAFNEIERNHYEGIEYAIDEINQSMRLVYQQDLSTLSSFERFLLFKIGNRLDEFKALESERRGGDYRIHYKLAMDIEKPINALEVIAHLIHLSCLIKQFRDSLIRSQPKMIVWQGIHCFDICYGGLTGKDNIEFFNYHLIVSTLKAQLVLPHTKRISELIASQTLFSQCYLCHTLLYPTVASDKKDRVAYVNSLPNDYPDQILKRLRIEKRLYGLIGTIQPNRIPNDFSKKFWRKTEWFMANSLIKNRKRLLLITDLFILSKLVILQHDCYFELSKPLDKALHFLLLHLADIEKEALRSTLISVLPKLSAMTCIDSLREEAYGFLSKLMRLNLDTHAEVDALISSETTIGEKQRADLETALYNSLSKRAALSLHEDKAYLFIEQTLDVIRTKEILQWLVAIQSEIKKNGFSLSVLNHALGQADTVALLKSDKQDANKVSQLLDNLYSSLPGGRQLSGDEKNQIINHHRLLPDIPNEEKKRAAGIKEIIHCALYEPQQRLGAKLLRQVRHILKKPAGVIQRDKTQRIEYAESVYQTYLINTVKKNILSDPSLARWDVAGRLVVPIRLKDEDYQSISFMITNEIIDKSQALEKVKGALGDDFVAKTTLCSIDVTSHPILETLYIKWLTNTELTPLAQSQVLKAAIHVMLSDDVRSSIIPLYEEIAIYVRRLIGVLSTLYDNHIGELKEYDEKTWESLFQVVSYDINLVIQTLARTALLSATKDNLLNVEALNVSLDHARKNLYFKVKKSIVLRLKNHERHQDTYHFYTAWEVIKQHLGDEKNHLYAYLMEDYFRADHRNELATRISPTHEMKEQLFNAVKSDFRLLIRRNHYRTFSGLSTITTLKKQQLSIRVPSIALQFEEKDNAWHLLSGQQAIIQISDKLEDNYFIVKQLMGGYKGPLVYQVLSSLTATKKSYFSLFGQKENESIELILKGAHLFNQYQINRADIDSLIYIQTIPVSYQSTPLSLSSKSPHIVEATLMTALSLLYVLSDYRYQLPFVIQEQIEGLAIQAHRLYVNYLKTVETNSLLLFSQSAQGKQLIKDLKHYQSILMIEIHQKEEISFLFLMVSTLYRLFFEDVYQQKHYGMLLQAITTFLSQVAIIGREAGNNAYQAVSGRAELLESLYHRQGEWSDEELAFINALNAFIKGEKNALLRVQASLDLAYNKHNIYGTQIYFEESTAEIPELKHEKLNKEDDLSGLVDMVQESPYVSWLIQAHSLSLTEEKQSIRQAFIEAEKRIAEEVIEVHNACPLHVPLQSHTIFPIREDILSTLTLYVVREIYLLSLMPILPNTMRVNCLKGLKQSFTSYYGLKHGTFSFKQWFYFLINLNHEVAFDLIITPVMRYFLTTRSENAISLLTLNSSGQLPIIPDACLTQHLLGPMGFVVTVYEDIEKKTPIKRLAGNRETLTINLLDVNREYRLLDSNVLDLFENDNLPIELTHFANQMREVSHPKQFNDLLKSIKTYTHDRLHHDFKKLQCRYMQVLDNDELRPINELDEEHIIEAGIIKESIQEKNDVDNSSDITLDDKTVNHAICALLENGTPSSLSLQDKLDLFHDTLQKTERLKLASMPYMILSPERVKTYQSHLSIIIQYVKMQLKQIEEERTRLLIALSPSTPTGRVFKDKADILDKIENKLIQFGEREKIYHSLKDMIEIIIKKIILEEKKMASTLSGRLKKTLYYPCDKNKLLKQDMVSIAMTGKAFAGLDMLPDRTLLQHEYVEESTNALFFMETNDHMTCQVTSSQLSLLSPKQKMMLALLMSRQLLINIAHYPSLGNKIIITSQDKQMGYYLWFVMQLLSDTLSFNKKMIEITLAKDITPLSKREVKSLLKDVKISLPKTWLNEVIQTIKLLGPTKKAALKSKSTSSIFQRLKKNNDQADK